MRSTFWPLLFLLCLWLVMTSSLPVLVDTSFVPNLILAGAIVFAATDIEAKWVILVGVFGLLLDIQSSLLVGSFCLGLVGLYILVRYIFMYIVPSSRVQVALPLVYIGASILLQAWLWLFGVFAGKIGWPVWPASIVFVMHLNWWVTALMGGILTLLLYVLWLEILHRIDRPIRIK